MDQATTIDMEASKPAEISSRAKQARFASVILTAAGLLYLYHASQLSLGDPPGTGIGAVPLLIGICWVGFGAYAAVRTPRPSAETGSWPRDRDALRVTAALLLCVMFVLALSFFGIFLTTGVFLCLMARLAGAPWKSALILSVVTPLVFWVVFSLGLKVSLPYGSLVTAILRS